MKQFIKYTSSLLLVTTTCVYASAQDLSTEITVDRTIVPQVRKVAPLPSVVPSLLPSGTGKHAITGTEFLNVADFSPESGSMDMPVYTGIPAPEGYKGYVWGGYFPTYNLGFGAGYRLIDSRNTVLAVSGQFDGYSYDNTTLSDSKLKSNTFGLQADLSQRLAEGVTLAAGAGYLRGLADTGLNDSAQGYNIFGGDIRVDGSARNIDYSVALSADYFGETSGLTTTGGSDAGKVAIPKAGDGIYGLTGTIRYDGGLVGVELGIGGSMRSMSGKTLGKVGEDYAFADLQHTSGGIYSINPAVIVNAGKAELRLGAEVDIVSGTSDGTVKVAPDVTIALRPDPRFAFFVRSRGGEAFNALSAQYAYSVFAPGPTLCGTSFTPVDASAGFVMQPWSALSVEVQARYAATRRAQMPCEAEIEGNMVPCFVETNLSGWSGGASLVFSPARVFDLKVSGNLYASGPHSGFAEIMDRAKAVLSAGATLKPVRGLAVDLGYELRTERKCYGADGTTLYNLGSTGDFNAGASYRVTDALTVFARCENILGRSWLVLPHVSAQKLHGLVGAMYRF